MSRHFFKSFFVYCVHFNHIYTKKIKNIYLHAKNLSYFRAKLASRHLLWQNGYPPKVTPRYEHMNLKPSLSRLSPLAQRLSGCWRNNEFELCLYSAWLFVSSFLSTARLSCFLTFKCVNYLCVCVYAQGVSYCTLLCQTIKLILFSTLLRIKIKSEPNLKWAVIHTMLQVVGISHRFILTVCIPVQSMFSCLC